MKNKDSNRIYAWVISLSFLIYHLAFSVACSDFLYDESDEVIYAEDHPLDSDADTLFNIAGIMNKMQAIADRTILLGELRGDLVSVTNYASAELRQIAEFDLTSAGTTSASGGLPAGTTNKYNQPRDYYAIINNCNYYIAKADTALRNNRNEYLFMKEYAAVKAFRAWTYLQLVLNYQRVPFVTEPILTKEQSEQDFEYYDIRQVCDYFISDLAPYADVETPSFATIRNTNSKFFYYPVNILLGDLNLWAGNYRTAAEYYYRYLSTRNGPNSTTPVGTNAVRFSKEDSRWLSASDSWSYMSFELEEMSTQTDLITMIPGDSIPSEGNYSELRDLFNTNENNDYHQSISPSKSLINLSAAQKYCHYTSGNEYVLAPEGLSDYMAGDLRLQAVYTASGGLSAGTTVNGKRISNYSTISKYATRNVHILRRSMVYLRLAEALNRAGFPRFAFQILKQGVNNSVIESDVVPYYLPEHAEWLRSFNFPNAAYVLETPSGLNSENTMGLHSHGSGYTASNPTYVMPDSVIADSLQHLQYQIERVEDLIVDEEALEFAFEGHRYYDLMRIALRRGEPDLLADKVARRAGTRDEKLYNYLQKTENWYLPFED